MTEMKKTGALRILVVDDTVVYRKIVSDVLNELPGVEVAGIAHNGKIAITKIDSLKPDLLTLDIEMPEVNGLEVLAHIRDKAIDVGAIMLSTLTRQGTDMTMKALELGAFDFIPKPQSGSMAENKEAIKNTITPMLNAFASSRSIKKLLSGGMRKKTSRAALPGRGLKVNSGAIKGKSEMIAIGISTGGPKALSVMMPKIPPDIGVPILIVQHMPPVFTQSLARSLNSKCSIEVKEAKNGDRVQPNKVFIAPGGKQMKVAAGPDGKSRVLRITDDPPENSCKPSVDYLFRSVAHHYVGRSTGVIMTGMGSDGTLGLKLMKRNGAVVIAQDKATCVVYGMPKESFEAGIVDVVAPLDKIAFEICRTVKFGQSD